MSSSSSSSSSRFPRLKSFKLKSDAAPPLPPPKDVYNRSLFSRSAASLVPSLSPESIYGPATPSTPYLTFPSAPPEFAKRSNNGRTAAGSPAPSASGGSLRSLGRGGIDLVMDGSTDSGSSCPNAMYLLNGASSSAYTVSYPTAAGLKPKKSVFRLANLAKRNRSKKDLSDGASTSAVSSVSEHDSPPKPDGDEGISMPWNFQHNIHVDEGYIGLPPSWSSALSQVGFNEDEIAAIHARRRAAATTAVPNASQPNTPTAYSNGRPPSPHASTMALLTPSAPSSNVLLQPVPRSTSLRKGRDVLTVHPPSVYSIASSNGGSTFGGSSAAPSPRAPSFSVKSFVSTIKSSLTSDSASMRDGAEESDQYVLVSGDGPGEDVDQGMGDEAFIDPYPYDTSSISSHQTRIRQMSQEQQTPRTPGFPQIQVQRAHSDAEYTPHSSALHAPSPLVYSTSLPIPTPPRGYTYSTSPSPFHSLVSTGLRPGPASAPPRTPPRRIYHVANASSDSYDGTNYTEPPPAYASPKKGEWIPKKEKECLGIAGNPPPPNRPIPPAPTVYGASNRDSGEEDREASATTADTTGSSVDNIPRTADQVLDISSYYSDNAANGDNTEVDPALRATSPTPPLVIDKRLAKLAMHPPRISFHQEGDLEDWSESLFSAIGGKKRSSILMGEDAAGLKKERRTTLRPMLPLPTIGDGDPAPASSSTEVVAPTLPDVSSGTDLTPGSPGRGTIEIIEEGDEIEQAKEKTPEDEAGEPAVDVDITTIAVGESKEVDGSPAAPSTPVLPDVSLGLSVSSLGEDLEQPASAPQSPRRTSVESLPPSPPPKPKPAPLAMPPAATLAPPRTNIITGVSGRSPVNSLFGQKPQPLPIPIPPSQIRAQLRPAPPKSPHPPPTLPLPPLRRISSQPSSLAPPPQSQLPLPPVPSPPKVLKLDPTASGVLSGSRPNSSHTLHAIRANPDRDSDLSTITVTPATIATAKTEVVRTAVASVVDSDTVSVASRRESVVSTAETKHQTLAYDKPDRGGESPHLQEREGAPLTSSVSLLRDSSQSKWPTPPPPPVELGTDSAPRRVSRFRTTSLGRVSQLQAMNAAATSPISSHSSHGSSDTVSSSTSESAPLTTPKGLNGIPSAMPKSKGSLATEARLLDSTTDTFGGLDIEVENGGEGEDCFHPSDAPPSDTPASTSPPVHPLLAQLQPYVSPRDPASCFTHLVEIAEGESGSVFAARVVASFADISSREGNAERPIPPGTSHVAVKRIPLPPIASSPSLSDDAPISNKLVSVLHELVVLKNLEHAHLLLPDAIYVSKSNSNSNSADEPELARVVDTSLWIRMELMERSLADVIGLVAEGLALQERLIARFASDILHGLDYLQRQHVAHRDVRSDNLLVNASGVVKLADFSNAIRVDRNSPTVNGVVGVLYWQAPEMRAGPYNALKVDVWSLGATVWELAETVPPFSTPASPSTQVSFAIQTARHLGPQWPRLTHPDYYSRTFHEFLKLCGRESAARPGPGELLNTPFIRNACGRAVILQLLSQCRAIEETIAAKEALAGPS